MKANKLLCEKRDLAIKAKKLIKDGLVPASVYGHHLEPISIQIKQADMIKFFQVQSIGSQVQLDIDGKEQLAIAKESQRDPVSHKIIHVEFQAITSGEKIKVTLPIYFLNKDSLGVDKVLQEQMSEIEISTLPKFLIDHIDIDISKYGLGDSILVRDLDIYNDKNFDVLTPKEAQVCVITYVSKYVEETPKDEVNDGASAVISAKKTEA
jgi:large subunit ribosomal protein L25